MGASRTEFGSTALHDKVLELLKGGILNDWIDDENQSRSNTTPQSSNAVFVDELLGGFEEGQLFDDDLFRRRGVT